MLIGAVVSEAKLVPLTSTTSTLCSRNLSATFPRRSFKYLSKSKLVLSRPKLLEQTLMNAVAIVSVANEVRTE
jgi:hypothetical protein